MTSLLKQTARLVLHQMGGLSAIRFRNRRNFSILTFHEFHEPDRPNLEAICSHVSRHFEPVTLSRIVDAISANQELPDNAITITVDDGYENYLLHGHPVFQKFHIPSTVFVVSGFAAGRLWLWTDQIEFVLRQTALPSLLVVSGGQSVNLDLATPENRSSAIYRIQEDLKLIPNRERIDWIRRFAATCRVEIPPHPPRHRAAMDWAELLHLAHNGVEIGSHAETHPILSRVDTGHDLRREIEGSKLEIEEHLGLPVRHFCYPNGQPRDINADVIRTVRECGYHSAVTTSVGLNSMTCDRFQLQRSPIDPNVDFQYALERLAGLHLQAPEVVSG